MADRELYGKRVVVGGSLEAFRPRSLDIRVPVEEEVEHDVVDREGLHRRVFGWPTFIRF